jgi:hypothetical protein
MRHGLTIRFGVIGLGCVQGAVGTVEKEQLVQVIYKGRGGLFLETHTFQTEGGRAGTSRDVVLSSVLIQKVIL